MDIWVELTHDSAKKAQHGGFSKAADDAVSASGYHSNSVSAKTQVWPFHSSPFNTTKSNLTSDSPKFNQPPAYAYTVTTSTLTLMNAEDSLKPATNTLLNKSKLLNLTLLPVWMRHKSSITL